MTLPCGVTREMLEAAQPGRMSLDAFSEFLRHVPDPAGLCQSIIDRRAKKHGAVWYECRACGFRWPYRAEVEEAQAAHWVQAAQSNAHLWRCRGCNHCGYRIDFRFWWEVYAAGTTAADLPGNWRWRERMKQEQNLG